MRIRSRRRLALAALAVAAVAGFTALHLAQVQALRDAARTSGWTLLALVLLLAAYGARKRFPYPPLLDASTWLRAHAWVGIATLVVFALHAGLDVPAGGLERTLAAVFAAVAGSGLLGLFLSRTVPPRLTLRGHEVLYERIPALRRGLGEEARERVEGLAVEGRVSPLGELYQRRLAAFFAGPRNARAHLLQSRRPLHALQHELAALDRYLDEREREAAAELGELIEAKDALDYHVAMQGLLKGWVLVHVPLTAALLLLMGAHALLATGLPGGAP